MGRLIELHRAKRRQASPDTSSASLIGVYRTRVTSSIRIDLEHTPKDRRRYAIWDLRGQPAGTRVTLHVGSIPWPDPEWLDVLAYAIVEDEIYLELETAPDLRGRWHHGLLGAIAEHRAAGVEA